MGELNHSKAAKATMVEIPAAALGYCGTMVEESVALRKQFPLASDYGLRLKMAMRLDGWIDAAPAGELGLSGAAIGKFWSGKTKMFAADNHMRACSILRVDPAWLALGLGEPRPERMALRDLNGIEGQLVTLFRGAFPDDQDEILRLANQAYAKRHPLPSPANPWGMAPPPLPLTPAGKKEPHR